MGVALSTAPATSCDAIAVSPQQLERLSAQYALSRDPRLRELLILHHQRLVRSIAVRFLGFGETLEDLIQVGNIGLINAIDRFDPHHGTRFSTYATPNIFGEIRRYFRDKVPALKYPRWVVDVQRAARRAALELSQELQRHPTSVEIAARLDESEERVLIALELGEAGHVLSLDATVHTEGSEASALGELVGGVDQTLSEFERFGDLRRALVHLCPREQEVIVLRFFHDQSQAAIAQRLGLSQMHVSRLQQRALRRLHGLLAEVI